MIYLAGPITAKDGYTVEQNVASAVAVYFQLVRAGHVPFCPQLGATLPAAFVIDYERWMAYDFAVIDVCDTVLMLPRWQSSPGAVREHEYALLMGKRLVYDVRELL
jgi:hypothetical protein